MQQSPELEAAMSALLAFLKGKVPHKVVTVDGVATAWFPLAKLLLICKYRSPASNNGQAPLDLAKTSKMLLKGRIQICISLTDFAWLLAPSCRVPVVQQFAAAFLNRFVISQYKSSFVDEKAQGDLALAAQIIEQQERLLQSLGDPAFAEAVREPDSKFVVAGGEIRLAGTGPRDAADGEA